ncbi:MAG: serine/threonine-protein kinase, partial [Planctomycetota bacterium]
MMSCAVEVPTWNLGQLQTELPKNVLTGSLRYEEFRPLGQGGKAEVFRCRDVTLGRDVAFKVLHYSLMESSVEQRMLVREARIMATLDHSHIPPIHDLGRDRYGRPYFTMALIQGSTLRDLMEAALAAADSADADATQLELVAHVLHAGEVLHHAHQLGVVHCDVKPENLVIGTDGKIRIIDWGLAALTVETELEEERLEDSWGRQGSPLYMSPEQVACDPMLQPATDIYSLACVLYECLTHES